MAADYPTFQDQLFSFGPEFIVPPHVDDWVRLEDRNPGKFGVYETRLQTDTKKLLAINVDDEATAIELMIARARQLLEFDALLTVTESEVVMRYLIRLVRPGELYTPGNTIVRTRNP